MNWVQGLLSLVAGLAAAIPLVIKLIQYVQAAVKEKNWNRLLDLVMDLMAQAEVEFDHGATRKEWVLAMVQQAASSINYDVDLAVVSGLIDSLCALTKRVNPPVGNGQVNNGQVGNGQVGNGQVGNAQVGNRQVGNEADGQ